MKTLKLLISLYLIIGLSNSNFAFEKIQKSPSGRIVIVAFMDHNPCVDGHFGRVVQSERDDVVNGVIVTTFILNCTGNGSFHCKTDCTAPINGNSNTSQEISINVVMELIDQGQNSGNVMVGNMFVHYSYGSNHQLTITIDTEGFPN